MEATREKIREAVIRYGNGFTDSLEVTDAILALVRMEFQQKIEALEKELASCQKRGQRYRELLLQARMAIGNLVIGGEFANEVDKHEWCMASSKEFDEAVKLHEELVKEEAALSTEEEGV